MSISKLVNADRCPVSLPFILVTLTNIIDQKSTMDSIARLCPMPAGLVALQSLVSLSLKQKSPKHFHNT